MSVGGGFAFPFGYVKLTPAPHGPEVAGSGGSVTCVPTGFWIDMAGIRLYHAGDTALTTDMELLRGRVDVALLPIGDNFTMGPGDAARAVELMIADKEAEARTRAHELESINSRRRSTDSETMEQAVEMVSNYYDMEKTASMVLHHPDWHLGVIGIVASRLVDQYYRPAIMLSTVDGKIKGSARSIEGFNIYEALKQCEDLLEQFGGHEYAAGLTMSKENLEEFRRRMNDIAFDDLRQTDFEPELSIDDELDLSQMDLKFWKLLSQFEPFGPGNHRPVFVSRSVDVNGIPTIVGKGHLKMSISHNGSGAFDAIGFNMHEYMPTIRNSPQGGIDIAYSLEENYWNGKRTLQVRLKDIKVNEEETVGV
jgi:single-stranded-DNA-specific exonuclease